eukprot:16440630-Heterocapsa_arctica.AAC.1
MPPDVQVFLTQSDRELWSLKESSCSLSDSQQACGHTRASSTAVAQQFFNGDDSYDEVFVHTGDPIPNNPSTTAHRVMLTDDEMASYMVADTRFHKMVAGMSWHERHVYDGSPL